MSWIADADDSSETVAAAFARDREALGYVANYTRVFALRPAAMEGWRALNGGIKGGMDLRRYELATLAAARRLRSSYCSLAHGKVLAESFDGPDVVRSIAADPATAELSDIDRAVVTLADKVAAGAADMTEADLGELRGLGLDDAEILDVVLAAAARCFFSTVLDAVGASPDPAYRDLDPQLRESLTVGRPIEEPVAT